MENETSSSFYEDARKQRILDNKKRFEDLGLLKLSKNLSQLTKSEKSQNKVRLRQTSNHLIEPTRRSTRARNQVSSYRDEVEIKIPRLRKRSRFSSSWASYLARPIDEVKTPTHEQRARAFKLAEKLQSNLQDEEHPSFVKLMVRSHVYSCFWLGLPSSFCEEHLPKSTVDIVLEDEEGTEYDAVFISKRSGLSGGWRAFALDHKLDDGDALVFQLIEPSRFKVYIVRAFDFEEEQGGDFPNEEVEKVEQKAKTNKPKKNGVKNGGNQKKNLAKSKKNEKISPVITVATRRSSRNKVTA